MPVLSLPLEVTSTLVLCHDRLTAWRDSALVTSRALPDSEAQALRNIVANYGELIAAIEKCGVQS